MKKRTTLAAVLLAVLFGMTAFAAPLTETVESDAEVSIFLPELRRRRRLARQREPTHAPQKLRP